MPDEPSLVEMLWWLQDAMQRDPDIAAGCRLVMEMLGVDSLAAWSEEEPDMIAELYEAMKNLEEQAPLEDTITFTAGVRDDRSAIEEPT